MNHTTKQVITIAALLVFIGILFFFGFRAEPQDRSIEVQENEESVIVEDTVATSGSLQVPPGFPTQIPVEEENLLEGFKITYVDRQLVEFVLKYESDLSPEDKRDEYFSYMTDAGYEVSSTESDEDVISGVNGSSSLMVGIALESGKTIVRVKYYER